MSSLLQGYFDLIRSGQIDHKNSLILRIFNLSFNYLGFPIELIVIFPWIIILIVIVSLARLGIS